MRSANTGGTDAPSVGRSGGAPPGPEEAATRASTSFMLITCSAYGSARLNTSESVMPKE
jgi:hypothetical protein